MESRPCVCIAQHVPRRGASVRTMTAARTARATTSGSISGTTNRILSCQSIQTGVRPTHSLATGKGSSILGDKAAGARNWQLNSISADSKKYSKWMEYSPSCEPDGPPASQEIPRVFRNPKVHYRIYNSPPLGPVPSPALSGNDRWDRRFFSQLR